MDKIIYGRHHDLVDRYGIPVSEMTTDMFRLSYSQSDPFLIHDLSPVCKKCNTANVTNGAGTAYPSGEHAFAPDFLHVREFVLFTLIILCIHVLSSVL